MRFMSHKIISKCLYPLVAVFALLGIAGTAQAAIYIKYDGLDGESKDKDHKSWSDLLSFDQSSIPQAAKDQQRTKGETTLGDIVVRKYVDSTTDALFSGFRNQEIFSRVEIDFCEPDITSPEEENCYLHYELEKVLITSYETSASSGDERAQENMTISFKEIEREYFSPSPRTP